MIQLSKLNRQERLNFEKKNHFQLKDIFLLIYYSFISNFNINLQKYIFPDFFLNIHCNKIIIRLEDSMEQDTRSRSSRCHGLSQSGYVFSY
jgi:hypothetical protein